MTDYYELGKGCCLRCPSAYPGCLCYSCNCKKCYWYDQDMAWEGLPPCRKAIELKEESRKKWIAEQKEKQKEENEKYKNKIEKYGVDKFASRKVEDKCLQILYTYTCQKCKVDFSISEDMIIIPFEVPLCPECLEENAKRYEEWKKNKKG